VTAAAPPQPGQNGNEVAPVVKSEPNGNVREMRPPAPAPIDAPEPGNEK